MYYYTFAALIWNDGNIIGAMNVMHKSEATATVIDFKRRIEMEFAGSPENYDQIIIPRWQELNKETYDYLETEFGKENDKRADKLEKRKATI